MGKVFALSTGIASGSAMRRATVSRCLLVSLLVAEVVAGIGIALSLEAEITISQRHKQFQPGTVTIDAGQPLVIVNDDGGTVHHAYVESDSFNFDSGDQNPGTKTRIVFPSKGDFRVLCGIHPKMRLDVHVR